MEACRREFSKTHTCLKLQRCFILCADEASLAMKIMVRVLGNGLFNTKSELLYTLEGNPKFYGLSSGFP